MDDIRPWDRQPSETAKAYEAFCVYRDMGLKRNVRAVAAHLTKSEQLIKGWSSRHKWPDRIREWDSMPSRKTEEAYEDMARKIAAQHSRLATKLADRLEKNLDMLPEGADPSMRFSTAMGAARQSHQFAAELSRPKDTKAEAINEAIVNLLQKLGADE